MRCQLNHDRRAGRERLGQVLEQNIQVKGRRVSVSPGQGCTWLKTLGPLCVPEPEVNPSEVTDGQKVPRTQEHTPQAVSEQVGVPWSEAC